MSEHVFPLVRAVQKANCIRRQIGAVIYDSSGLFLALGWNAPEELDCETDCPRAHSTIPAGGYDCFESFEAYKAAAGECIAIHAEERALRNTRPEDRKDGVMYITAQPCGDCEKLLQESGLARWEVLSG